VGAEDDPHSGHDMSGMAGMEGMGEMNMPSPE
jgi:hypothetical protein